MARVTIAMFPEPGHLLPTLRLASRLQAAGHVVTYAVTGAYTAALSARGFATVRVFDRGDGASGDVPLVDGRASGLDLWNRLALAVGGRGMTVRQVIRAVAPDLLLPALSASQPDLLLCDAKIVAACGDLIRGACPAALLALRSELPVGDPVDCADLVLCPEALELPSARLAVPGRIYCEPSVFMSGPIVARAPRVSTDDNLVYCCLGTQAAAYAEARQVLQATIDAFAGRAGYRLVVAAGPFAEHLERTGAANVTVCATVDQRAMLHDASLAILHGGLGGVKEAIMAATPMVIVPFLFDQRPNGARVVFHGLGEMCAPRDANPDNLFAAALRQLASAPGPRHAMRDEFERAEHDEPAVTVITRTLQGVEVPAR